MFDREARFIDEVLLPLCVRHPGLRIVFEHITTRAAVEFVRSARAGVAATITPQHLLMNRNALFAGGIRPHLYCLPVLKTEDDREALLEAATSGDPRFFLGTDSAPHARHTKESGLWLRRHLQRARRHRTVRRGLRQRRAAAAAGRASPPNSARTSIVCRAIRTSSPWSTEPWKVPDTYDFGGDALVPLRAGETIGWRLARERIRELPRSHAGEVTAMPRPPALMSRRFRGFLPVVIDVETGGFNSRTDALLEIAAVFIDMDAERHAVARRHAQLPCAALPGRAARSGVTERHRHRSVSSVGPPCPSAKPSSASSARSATRCAPAIFFFCLLPFSIFYPSFQHPLRRFIIHLAAVVGNTSRR